MKTKTKIILAVIALFAISLGGLVFYVRFDLSTSMSGGSSRKAFEIFEGQGVREIVADLKENGFVRNEYIIYTYLKFKKYDTKLKAGTYLLDTKNSPVETIDIIVSGDTAIMKITILEGWDKVDIANYLEDKGVVTRDDFYASLTKAWDYDFTKSLADLEGYLYPDTYYIPYKATSDEIVKTMLDNFDSKLAEEMRAEIINTSKSIYEIVTMASVVEKEVFGEEDRRIVAGIFWNRILEGMPLQSDATINFITESDNPQPTYFETREESPYNTYLNKGLPLGPICSPSIESIKAAIFYEDTEYRYYLNRQDTGETIFSRTYEEHLINKRKYLN